MSPMLEDELKDRQLVPARMYVAASRAPPTYASPVSTAARSRATTKRLRSSPWMQTPLLTLAASRRPTVVLPTPAGPLRITTVLTTQAPIQVTLGSTPPKAREKAARRARGRAGT